MGLLFALHSMRPTAKEPARCALDGLLVPTRSDWPVYFVEVQFSRKRRFYANLFAKVFSYLEANDPNQEWIAVALSPIARSNRSGDGLTKICLHRPACDGFISTNCRLQAKRRRG